MALSKYLVSLMEQPNYRFVTWQEIENASLSIYAKMLQNNYKPQSIIGLLRGGIVPARIFSDFFDILLDFFALDIKLYTGINERNDEPSIKSFCGDVKDTKILIIDDIWDSGKTMEGVLNYLGDEDITTATLFWKETAKGRPTYYAETVKENTWIVFPWENYEFWRLINDKANKDN